MIGAAAVGYLRDKLGVVWRLRSLWAKMSLLAVIFALVPLFLYFEFSKAYQDSQDLLLQSVRGQGRVMSQSLLPLLENADGNTLLGLGPQLERFAGEVTTIKLLLDPVGSDDDGFYYIASWPTVVASNLEAERQILAGRGVLDQLTQSCRGELPFSLMYDRPTGGSEIVTVVTPLLTAVGCWAVVASFSADAFPAARLGQPYWATPTVQFAAAIYLMMVVITFSTLFGIGGGLRRFARQAREIREQRRRTGSFAARNEIPELADVAAEFDRMVDALNRSAATIRRAAEDNAHAFKAPIAVIRQSLEPLRRALPTENQRVQRAIDRAAQCRGDARHDRGREPHPARPDGPYPPAGRAAGQAYRVQWGRRVDLKPPYSAATKYSSETPGCVAARLRVPRLRFRRRVLWLPAHRPVRSLRSPAPGESTARLHCAMQPRTAAVPLRARIASALETERPKRARMGASWRATVLGIARHGCDQSGTIG